MQQTSHKIWTIGHSNHPIDIFIYMLQAHDIKLLADIRSYPGSKYCPQYNCEALKLSLSGVAIDYKHMPELGGRRQAKKDSKNTAWRNKSFRGYADYMETQAFSDAIHQLEEMARVQNVAYMCSEVLWWSCHRSMVSDYLKLKGWTVIHIMPKDKIEEHKYTSPARIVNGKLDYSKDTSEELFDDM